MDTCQYVRGKEVKVIDKKHPNKIAKKRKNLPGTFFSVSYPPYPSIKKFWEVQEGAGSPGLFSSLEPRA